jgi:hypothetical protein
VCQVAAIEHFYQPLDVRGLYQTQNTEIGNLLMLFVLTYLIYSFAEYFLIGDKYMSDGGNWTQKLSKSAK